ncbi:MAG TPA: DUF4185 domain-containing protein [Candidatus Hydrogenedentes bacterium]|nr:DUF4185 domain-containing protein [Candidatus Hydrogenedentota bacterium]
MSTTRAAVWALLPVLLYSCVRGGPNRGAGPEIFGVVSIIEKDKWRAIVEEAPEWNNLFKRYDGWTGGDGIYAIPLSGWEAPGKADSTKTVFVFSDSFVGEVDPETMARRNYSMVNNALAVLAGGRAAPENIRFLWGRARDGGPAAAFVPTTRGTPRECWYWLQDGVCLNGAIYILPMVIEPNPAGGEGFQFKMVGLALLKIPVNAEGPQPAQHSQQDAPLYDVNDERTLYFGAAMMPNTLEAGAPQPDGYVYVYGRYETDEAKLCVARVKPEDFEDFDQWRFWNGQAWSSDIGNTAPLGRGGPELSVSPVIGGPLDGKYLMVSMHLERDLYIRIGESPIGPFGPRIDIYHTREPDAGQGIYTYNAKAHPNLSPTGAWLVSYNVNTTRRATTTNNADIYRPRFLKVRFEARP